MYNVSEMKIKFNTKHLPFEYKWLEYRLIINQELYDKKVIDLKTFNIMEQSILSRLTKIKNGNQSDMTNNN